MAIFIETGRVAIDHAACARVASWIAVHHIPADQEDLELPNFTPHEIGNFYLALVAICHQTSPVGMKPLLGNVRGKLRRGWDFLLSRFEEAACQDRDWLLPEAWSECTGHQLSTLFRDENHASSLSQCDRRAELLRDLGTEMKAMNWQHADDIFVQASGRIAAGKPNLLDSLRRFSAYRDPVQKKSYYFLSLMRNHGLWQFADPDSLGPPVDYHEIRGHLRLGTVVVLQPELAKKLQLRGIATEAEDLEVRGAVHDAILEISKLSGIHDPIKLHYLFWNVFRACCTRESPHCQRCADDCSLPERYVPLAASGGGKACPFRSVCVAAANPENRRLTEYSVPANYDFY